MRLIQAEHKTHLFSPSTILRFLAGSGRSPWSHHLAGCRCRRVHKTIVVTTWFVVVFKFHFLVMHRLVMSGALSYRCQEIPQIQGLGIRAVVPRLVIEGRISTSTFSISSLNTSQTPHTVTPLKVFFSENYIQSI